MSKLIPERVILSIVSFFGFMCLYLTRYSFSIISVSMITQPDDICKNETGNCSSSFLVNNTFDWDERTRALILGSFTYGYCMTQIIGGRLAELYGAKIVFGSAIVVPALFGFLMPMASELSYWYLTVLRFLQGIFQGMCFPSMFALTGQWIPPHERSRFLSVVVLSTSLSMVWVMPFSGYLCDAYSWQTSFHIVSIVPLIWGIFWFGLVHSKPSTHPRISKEEREYIEKCVQAGGSSNSIITSVPWKSIFTSIPVLAIIVLEIGDAACFAIFTFQLPNYLKFAFDFHLTKTGFLSGLPFFCRYIGAVISSCIADHLISKKILKISTTRRIFAAVCLLLPAIILSINIVVGMTDVTIFISLCCAFFFFNGSIGSSLLSNFTDIAPNYAGTLMGISNTVGNLVSFFSVMATGEILNVEASIRQWRIVFGSCIPAMVIATIFYLFFMRGSPQPWNFHQEHLDDQESDSHLSDIYTDVTEVEELLGSHNTKRKRKERFEFSYL